MIEVKYLLLNLNTDRPVSLGASPLSLYISSSYQKKFGQSERPLSGGSYPLLQYKVIRGAPLIVAINEGCELLWEIYDNLDEINKNGPYKILERRIIDRVAFLGPCESRLKFRFLTPWLAISEAELNKLKPDPRSLNRVLAGILENNLTMLARNFQCQLDKPVEVSINIKDENIVQKDTGIAGLFGTFYTNFEIPQFLSLGKGVGRGFGTIKQN
ncbi:MAG: CRISPR-associated endonuclease Cas6 [candidate division Zixibacteria bacterium]|nr:CRISPR-associated endonuclease Cas6 [candidate division Zixibacteria bacterium]